jgi:HD superfamily phosphohydrolase
VLHEYGKVLKQTPDQTFENLQKAEILLKWSHEEQSIKMLDYLLKKNKIDLAREENGALDDRDLIFIKELINGAPINGSEDQFEGRGYDKIFLYEIVSNKKTGLDVDRLDYLQRDTEAALGLHCKVFEKLCESVAVCREDSGRLVLAYPEEQVQGVMQLYTTRIKMYTEVYMHRKVLVMVSPAPASKKQKRVHCEALPTLTFPVSRD